MVATKRKINSDAVRIPKKAKLQGGDSRAVGSAHAKPSRIENSVPQHSSSGSDLSEDEDHSEGEGAGALRKATSQAASNKGMNGAATEASATGMQAQKACTRSF